MSIIDYFDRELECCDREIAEARAALLAGARDIEGKCLAIHDWSGERRAILRDREAVLSGGAR